MATMQQDGRVVQNALGLVHRPMKLVQDVTELNPGDHIAFKRSLYWHHAIIEGVVKFADGPENVLHLISIIHYTNDNKDLPKSKENACVQCDVLEFEKDTFYIVHYEECLTPEVVLRNARHRYGETDYDLIYNNCECFAVECKTGKKCSSQSSTATWWVGTTTIKAVSSVATFGAKKVVTKLATTPGLVAGRVMSGATKVCKVAPLTVVASETVTALADIYRAHRYKRKNALSHDEYVQSCKKSLVCAGGGVGGSLVGEIVGSALIPVPVIGTVVGCVVGGTAGRLLGSLCLRSEKEVL